MSIENDQSAMAAAEKDLEATSQNNITVPAFPAPERQTREALGIPAATDQALQSDLDKTFTESMDALKENASKMESLSSSYLKGEIPSDVQAQIRRLTSERGLASGIGRGQAGQAMTARDLGLTSMDLQSQGVQITQAANAVRETLGKLAAAKSEFNKSFDLETAKFQEDVRRTDLDITKIDQMRRQFNAEQNMRLVQQVADLASSRAELQYRLAAANIEDVNVVGSMDQVIGQLDKLITQASLTV